MLGGGLNRHGATFALTPKRACTVTCRHTAIPEAELPALPTSRLMGNPYHPPYTALVTPTSYPNLNQHPKPLNRTGPR